MSLYLPQARPNRKHSAPSVPVVLGGFTLSRTLPSISAARVHSKTPRSATLAAKANTMNDSYDFQRFIDAQNPVFEQVCAELGAGQKRGHWMWFIFPQLRGLGYSEMATRFAISSLDEAEAYLKHPILGSRLRECTRLVLLVEGRSINQIFGYPDDLKFRSSMTLFASTISENQIFKDALQKGFAGEPDRLTIERLRMLK